MSLPDRPAEQAQFPEQPGLLVVDDDQQVLAMLHMTLAQNGFRVWLAASGFEAIELFREHQERIVLVLLDVCMPGLDGPQTLAALRELNPGVMACFMSGDPGNYQPEELIGYGAVGLIHKPFHLKQLVKTLQMLTSGVNVDLVLAGGDGRA